MRTVRTKAPLRAALAHRRRAGDRLALVPTMGFLHEGHLSLIRAARSACDLVVVSLFVNPTQFDDAADLASYPRDERRDAALAAAAGADLLFAPAADEMYPAGFDTTVSVGGVTAVLEGEHRGRGHFDAVATVVTKLFNLVQPDAAYFGQKDAQQAVVVRRLARDLDMPVEVVVCPTVRDRDGLALSSRNVRLSAGERERALALSRALAAADAAVSSGTRDAAGVIAAARRELDASGVDLDYLELRDADDLSPASRVNGRTLLAVAARVGPVRLIDNAVLGGT